MRRQDRLPGQGPDPVDRGHGVGGTQVDHGHAGAGVPEEAGRPIPRVVRRQHDRPPSGQDAVGPDQTLDRRREHDARQIVVREHGSLLDGPGGEHEVSRSDPVEHGGTRGRHEGAVEHAEGGCGGQDARPGVDRGRERPRLCIRLAPLLEQERVGSRGGRLGGRRESGRAAADHQDVDVQVHHLTSIVVLGPRDLAQSGLRADQRLDQRPRPAGAVEHLVVEARRHHERERVEPAVDVPAGGRPRVLALHAHAVAHGLDARANVRDPVDLHQAVRARPRHAHQTPWPVVLEGAAGDRDARRCKRRPHGVALESGDLPTFEIDRDRSLAPDALPLRLREPIRHAGASSRSVGQNVRRISFVDVCRSARNHLRHP